VPGRVRVVRAIRVGHSRRGRNRGWLARETFGEGYLAPMKYQAFHPSRRASVVGAALAGVWALFLLPPQLVEWADGPGWALALNDSPFYRGVDALRESLGLHDIYMVFGSAIAVSMLLLWWATGPVMAWLGWSGRVFNGVLLALAPVTVVSYVSHNESAPLHFLWGAEGFGLMILGVIGILVAVVTRAPGVRPWLRILIGTTLLIEVAFTLLLTYYPHGTVVGLALQAGIICGLAPRAERSHDTLPADA